MKVGLSAPDITELEIELVTRVLRTPTLSIGPMVDEFERRIADYVGTRHAVAVNSGTSGLHLLVRAHGLRDNDEVITPSFSFVASSNVILYERARPVFVDIDPETLCLDPDAVEAAITPRTKAILGVDAFGQPAQWLRLKDIARKHNLILIQDSCESLGAEINGIKCGNGQLSDGAVFAFYPNKQITTGEGGIIVTDNDEVALLCKSMRNHGRGEMNVWLSHERLGYNYRLDELSAALGVAQMQRIDEILAKRARVAALYNERLAHLDGLVKLPTAAPNVSVSWFVYVVQLAPEIDRDRVMTHLMAAGVGCRPYFTPIHLQPFYRAELGCEEGSLPVTERVALSTIALPFHTNLSADAADYVVEALSGAIRHG